MSQRLLLVNTLVARHQAPAMILAGTSGVIIILKWRVRSSSIDF